MSALVGLRIVELTERAAGSYCGKVLADLGAEVVVIEPPSGKKGRRPSEEDPVGEARFVYLNTNKSSHALDDSRGGHEFVELLDEADVLIDDAPHPFLHHVDLSRSRLLVWCSIRPFGLTGPYRAYHATHLTTFHAGGEGYLLPGGFGFSRFPHRPPLQIGANVAEHDAGTTGAIAILAALRQRESTRRGQRIDISDQEAQLTLNRSRLSRWNNDGVLVHRTANPYAIGGMIECANGYIQLVGIREEQWAKLAQTDEARCFGESPFDTAALRYSNAAGLGALLEHWCRARPTDLVVSVLATAGCAVGAFCEPADILDSPQLRHRKFFHRIPNGKGGESTVPGAPYRLSRTPARRGPAPPLGSFRGFAPRTAEASARSTQERDAQLPLAGVRIIDFTWAAAGPYATLLLALLGAEVIKIESSRRPDMARRGFLTDYGHLEKSPNFNELNCNKQSICVDLTVPRGREIVEALIAHSDVVVDNFRPGVLARLGFDAERLLHDYPTLVVACSSANGSTGPDAAGAGLASIFSATGGLSAQTGYEDGPPTEIGESTDYRSANFLAIALLAALRHRDRTGEGQWVDLSSREVVVALGAEAILAAQTSHHLPLRLGNRHRSWAPHNVYPCAQADEWIALAVRHEDDWRALCELLGEPELARRYGTTAERKNNEDVIDLRVTAWTSRSSSRALLEQLQAHGIPAAPPFRSDQLSVDAHLAARGVFVDVDHPLLGRQRVMRAPWRMSDAASLVVRHGPLQGQDRDTILTNVLGMSRSAIKADESVLQ